MKLELVTISATFGNFGGLKQSNLGSFLFVMEALVLVYHVEKKFKNVKIFFQSVLFFFNRFMKKGNIY